MPPLVIVAAPLSHWLNDGLAERYAVHTLGEPDGIGALPAEVTANAQILVTTGGQPLANSLIDALPMLRLIAVHGVGVDMIDVGYARSRGIVVTNTPDVLTDDVADMALALVLTTGRRIVVNDRLVRAGEWGTTPVPLARRMSGLRYGILGLGRIGTAIARRLEPIAGSIAYHNRHPLAASPYRYAGSAEALARDCDVLIVATSGGATSRHLVDAAVIDALGPDGMLINIGRGSSVDQAALVDALVSGRLGAAGLDVFEDEPRVPEALFALDQVVLQPHQASATTQTRKAMAELVLANVAAYCQGKPVLTPVA